jgi:hypothetical protein
VWPELVKLSLVVVAIVAGSWLLWLGLSSDDAASISPPPSATVFSVTPSAAISRPVPLPATSAFHPITRDPPMNWHWFRPGGCAPEVMLLLPLCDRPTPQPMGP